MHFSPRRNSLMAATLIVAATSMALAAPAGAQATGSSGGSSQKTANTANPVDNWVTSITAGLDVTKVGNIIGRQQTGDLGLVGSDLGVMAPIMDGEEFAIVFGDSFTAERLQGTWMSPVGVVATMGADGTITIERPLNSGTQVRQLISYTHTNMLTFLPSDIINIDGVLYMQGSWNRGIGNVDSTQIFASDDNGQTWRNAGRTKKSYMDGMGDLLSWERGPDGYIYVMSTRFQRNDPVYLSRFRPAEIGDRTKWQLYDPASRSWGSTASPVIYTNVEAGEMSLRYIDGYWVLVLFNEKTMAIEVRAARSITADWDSIIPANVVIAGTGGWGAAQTASNFTQLYGGFIVPGSTLSNMNILVSQWNTGDNSVYTTTQFNVKGLEKYFGMTPQLERAGQPSLEVTETVMEQITLGE